MQTIKQIGAGTLAFGKITVERDEDGDLCIQKTGGSTSSVWVEGSTVVAFIDAIRAEFNLVPAAVVAPKKSPNGPQAYKGNGKYVWETVVEGDDDEEIVAILRLRVPGGWLYSDDTTGGPMTFVPTPAIVGYPI